MELNEYFDKIYVINLDHRVDRMTTVIENFKLIGLTDYQRFSAIKTDMGWDGCNKSHLGVIEDARKNGYENFLVFEDDFVLHENFVELFTEFMGQLPSDWDMVYFGGNTSMATTKERVSKNLIKPNSILTTHCYGMKNTIYDKVLDESPNMSPQSGFFRGQVIDVYYSQKICPTHNVYLTNPMLCTQSNGYSDIEKRNVNYTNLIK